MIHEYAWALAGVFCLIVLFTMIAIGNSASKRDSPDDADAQVDGDNTGGRRGQ